MKVKSEREVTQSCPTLSDPMVCSLLGSSVHGIFQARVLEWGAIAFAELIKLSIHKQIQRNTLFVFEEQYYLSIHVIKYFCLIYLTRVSFLLRSIMFEVTEP